MNNLSNKRPEGYYKRKIFNALDEIKDGLITAFFAILAVFGLVIATVLIIGVIIVIVAIPFIVIGGFIWALAHIIVWVVANIAMIL